jgi:ABC-type branched-subunit amino acid transport system ATPase component
MSYARSGPCALSVDQLTAGYGTVPIVRELDIKVGPGEVVLLLGANGAGKTTTLQTIAGELPAMSGTIRLGDTIARGGLRRRARDGLGYLPEGRSVLRALTVRDNLKLGSGGVDAALEIAPELEPLLSRKAGLLSGGEQQILCLARIVAARPSVLMADEMSLGLAPRVVERMLRACRAAADAGAGVLLVEQHAPQALVYADRAVVLQRGRQVLEDSAAAILADLGVLERIYLEGVAGERAIDTAPLAGRRNHS